MKKISITVLDGKEMELARRLMSCGLSRSTALILVCLMIRAGETINEIAAASDLTTSTVSMALKMLRDDGIVSMERHKNLPRGRSTLHYSLNGGIDHLLTVLEAREERKVSRYMAMTAKVKSVVNTRSARSPASRAE